MAALTGKELKLVKTVRLPGVVSRQYREVKATAQVAAPRPSFDQLGKLLLLQAEAGVLSTVPALATEAEELIAELETRLEKRGVPE